MHEPPPCQMRCANGLHRYQGLLVHSETPALWSQHTPSRARLALSFLGIFTQQNSAGRPVRSPLAAASISSSSLASSTMPSVSVSARMALSMETGSPIWMAEAKVVCALTGSKVSQPCKERARVCMSMCLLHSGVARVQDPTEMCVPAMRHGREDGIIVFVWQGLCCLRAHHAALLPRCSLPVALGQADLAKCCHRRHGSLIITQGRHEAAARPCHAQHMCSNSPATFPLPSCRPDTGGWRSGPARTPGAASCPPGPYPCTS